MTQQTTVFGDPLETQVELEALGRVIRPWKRALGQVVEEFRVHFKQDEIRVDAVDAGNVMSIQLSLNPNALERYSVSDAPVTLGVTPDYLGTAFQHARYGKRSEDTLTLVADETHIETEVQRAFGDTDVTLCERVPVIDEKSVREDFDPPEVELPESVSVATEAFTHAITAMDDGRTEHITVEARPSGMAFSQFEDGMGRDIELACETTGDSIASFTADYLSDLANVLRASYAEIESVQWGDEYPLRVEFSRDEIYRGSVLVAPRIRGDGP